VVERMIAMDQNSRMAQPIGREAIQSIMVRV
jgi:hypothetical protein